MYNIDIKQLRKDKKLTQTDLANLLNCHQSFISSIEHGVRPMPDNMVEVLSNKYDDISAYIISSQPQPQQPNDDSAATPALDELAELRKSLLQLIENNGKLIESNAMLVDSNRQLVQNQQTQFERLIRLVDK